MAKKDITNIFLSFLKESHDNLDNFDSLLQGHKSYVEELYLEVLNKIKNPGEGGSILPKTPAPKRQGRGRKKRNTNDQQDTSNGQIENKRNDASDEPQVPTRLGRAASKAAVAKIKESQRQLNDLSSKMRRPDNSGPDVTNGTRHSNTRDSGVYDCLNNFSTTSSRTVSSSSKSVLLVPVQMKQDNDLLEDQELTSAEEKQDRPEEVPAPVAAEAHAAQGDSATPDRKRRSSSVPSTVLSKLRKTGESPKKVVDESPVLAARNEPETAQMSEAKVDSGNRRVSRSLSSSKKSVGSSLSPKSVKNNSVLQMVVDSSAPCSNNKNDKAHKECSVKGIETVGIIDHCNDVNIDLDVNHKVLHGECSSQDEDKMVNEGVEISELRTSLDSRVTSSSNKTEAPREIMPEFKAPLAKAPSPPPKRTTRTKTRQMNNANLQQVMQDPQSHEACGTAASSPQAPDTNSPRRTRTKKRVAEPLSQSDESDDSTRPVNNKKRKTQESSSIKELNCIPASLAVSYSENKVDANRRKSRTSGASISSLSSTSSKGKDTLTHKAPQPSVHTNASEKLPPTNEPKASPCSPVRQKKHERIAVVSVSPLSRPVLAASKRGSGNAKKSSSDTAEDDVSIVVCSDVQHVSVHDTSDDSVVVEEQPRSDNADESENQEEEEEQEEEPREIVQPPRRMTRSKVRQQQEKKLEEAEQLQQQLARAAAARQRIMSSKQPVLAAVKNDAAAGHSSGKFSPRPFGNRTGVRQLAAAYSEHMATASPQPRSERKHVLSRSSSTSRVPQSSSRMTPLSINRMRANLPSSSDSHHHRAKLGTPSQGSRPRNLVCGVKSFLGPSVQVQQAARPTKEQVEEQKQLELVKKREKEEETLRKKEEQMRAKRNETKRRNEERMRKVQEARLAAERKAAEAKETAEREKKLKEQRLKEEALRKKQLMIKKAEEEKRKRDEEQLLKEEEARKRKEEAEEKRRALLEQQEEEKRRLEKAKILEEERRAEERRLAIKREAERLAREKEELRLLKEREAARAAAKNKPPIFKPAQPQKQLNQTYDANSTYTVPGNSTFTVPASANTPKTPHAACHKTSASSQDSYDLTPASRGENDYGIDNLKSDDSSDDDCNPKKKVPLWATRKPMLTAIHRQEYNPPNVDALFPLQELMSMVNLDKIFATKKSRFNVRSSSAHWTTPPYKIFSNVF